MMRKGGVSEGSSVAAFSAFFYFLKDLVVGILIKCFEGRCTIMEVMTNSRLHLE